MNKYIKSAIYFVIIIILCVLLIIYAPKELSYNKNSVMTAFFIIAYTILVIIALIIGIIVTIFSDNKQEFQELIELESIKFLNIFPLPFILISLIYCIPAIFILI